MRVCVSVFFLFQFVITTFLAFVVVKIFLFSNSSVFFLFPLSYILSFLEFLSLNGDTSYTWPYDDNNRSGHRNFHQIRLKSPTDRPLVKAKKKKKKHSIISIVFLFRTFGLQCIRILYFEPC